MNTHAGYSKRTLTNTSVLLAGGGDKSLADFLGGIQYNSASHKLTQTTVSGVTSDVVTLIMTDENVKQTPKTDNVNRPLMMINGGTTTGELTTISIFSTGIYANAYNKMITANGFVKAGSSSSYVLLGDGGHKALSDFAMITDLSGYLTSQDHYKTSPSAGTAGTSSATSGSTIAIPYVTVNAYGHVTTYGTHTHTVSGFLTEQDHYKTSPTAGTAGTSSSTSGSTLSVPYVTVNANGHVTGYGTHTHTISGFLTALDHYKTSITAGTAGTSGATSGATLDVPYISMNANGHVTGYGTHTHSITSVIGSYTSNGGQQNPNYFGTNRVGFLMMNTPVNDNYLYKDWMIMDCYGGNDVGGGVAIGVNRQSLGAYIMRSASARTSWAESAELLGTHNYTTYCATVDHDHDDLYVSAVTIYGNYLRVTKNGSSTNLTIPYATNADTVDGYHFSDLESRYVNVTGDTMTGGIIMSNMETNSKRWMYGGTRNSGFKYDYDGDEAFIISAGTYSSSALSFYSGGRLTLNDSDGQWSSTTADMQIKQNCVGIGANVDTNYKLYVSGNTRIDGTLDILSEARLKIWNVTSTRNSSFGAEMVFLQTSIDYADPSTSWPDATRNDLFIQPYGGHITFGPRRTHHDYRVWVEGDIYATSGFKKADSSDDYVLLGGGGHRLISELSGSSSVNWADVQNKIRNSDEFNIVPSSYNGSMWFNYRSDASTNVTVSEYLFGNGSGSATASIKSGTVYPGSDATYDIGKTGSRWNLGYFSSGVWIGSTSYYSRLTHLTNISRLYLECYSSTYSGYVATCEGNPNNLTIIGVFDLYRSSESTTTWSLSNICGPCSFTLQQNTSTTDVTFKNRQSYVQSWTVSGNILRVYVNGPSSTVYAWKSTPYAVSCDARVMTRWFNNQPVISNATHSGRDMGISIECLCINRSTGSLLSYDSSSPGRYIYITSPRPFGYDSGDNGLAMDMMRMTGDLSYQRIRFVVFGYIS